MQMEEEKSPWFPLEKAKRNKSTSRR